MEKVRLDVRMTELGLALSREKAKALIASGGVMVNGRPARKAGEEVNEETLIEIKSDPLPFVSRGGLKLQKALEVFPIELEGKTCLDIGASTGGFTDCMLQHGAKHVCALDVGCGQLNQGLREDVRVRVMEHANARYMKPGWFLAPFDFASMDVSFISLKLILPPLFPCLREGGQAVALIKPQFEAGKSEVGKNGVVRDKKVHARVCAMCMQFAQDLGYWVRGLSFSPIKGPKGNIEFLLFLEKGAGERLSGEAFLKQAMDAVEQAHSHCIKE